MRSLLFLSVADFKSLRPPSNSEGFLDPFGLGTLGEVITALFAIGILVGLFLTFGSLLRGGKDYQPAPRLPQGPWILIDGSNVMHWRDNQPSLAPLQGVVAQLSILGYAPGVVFDANAGWKLFGRYMRGDELAQLLSLPRSQVFVVPKGEQADPYLLEVARDHKAKIVTNDRYRDWAEAYPEVLQPGLLVRGGWQDGAIALRGLLPAPVAATVPG
ncbi:MAG: hypothetical protein MUE52_02125 [Tabrizicola sp.]|jgi:hypothetical protein|nr:hypothetical protein [Tabrizicola sp.]